MSRLTFFSMASPCLAFFALVAGCGGPQQETAKLETRPLEEAKASDIITAVLTERGYVASRDVKIELSTKVVFDCDFKVNDQKIALEYVTRQDLTTMGAIPPPAPGSRLHVLPAKVVPDDPSTQGEPVYVFMIDENDYEYQFNPTSENRADVTFLEVESRMRRDLADFLAWYETSKAASK